jgi:hypothetical protein
MRRSLLGLAALLLVACGGLEAREITDASCGVDADADADAAALDSATSPDVFEPCDMPSPGGEFSCCRGRGCRGMCTEGPTAGGSNREGDCVSNADEPGCAPPLVGCFGRCGAHCPDLDGGDFSCGPSPGGLFTCCGGLPCRGECNNGHCQCALPDAGCPERMVCCTGEGTKGAGMACTARCAFDYP